MILRPRFPLLLTMLLLVLVECATGRISRDYAREQLLTTGLVIRSAPGYLETIAARDPIEARFVFGTWTPPGTGDVVQYNDTLKGRWEEITVDSTGWFQGPLLEGGYVSVSLLAEKEETVLLEGMGHSMVYVNGTPRAGNPYQLKETWEPWEPKFNYSLIPVKLRKGVNDLLFQCNRGILKVKLHVPRSACLFNVLDATVPDLIVGSSFETWCAVTVINTSSVPLRTIRLNARTADGREDGTEIPLLQPMSIRKVGFKIRGRAPSEPGSYPLQLSLVKGPGKGPVDTASITLRVVKELENRKETFISAIDGSVQYYSISPARNGEKNRPMALILSLHGAAVEAINQTASYAPKSWGHIVSPTNRRPYGYNWEDWGRLDAMEVFDIVKTKYLIDENRIYLTGHSMGGHGVYHIGSLFPDRFAALGPSAGWISFWTYRIRETSKNSSPLREMIQRATLPSETYTMARNFRQLGLYILHGSADDNVPPEQSRMMVDSLRTFQTDFVYHEQRGAGHWWDLSDEPGADCVDWPPMFDFFARHSRPLPERVRQIDFITANPGVSAHDWWVGIEAQKEQLRLSSVSIRLDPGLRHYSAVTRNVKRMSIDLAALSPPGPISIVIDSQTIGNIPWPAEKPELWLEQSGDTWSQVGPPSPSLKGPQRYGPFKDAFRNHMILVFGTQGSPEENRWAFEKARFDAERFWYQGNGSLDIVADVDFSPAAEPDRNVILYGNAETNRCWKSLLGESPVQVRRGLVSVGGRVFRGEDLSCLCIRPRSGSAVASVGIVAGSGIVGMRHTNKISYLMPGIGFPDCLVESADVLLKGEEGIRAAGIFGVDWSVEAGDFVWNAK